MIKDKKLVLFGAGVFAKKYKALLEYLNLDFEYFTDNDTNKTGTFLYGKEIILPENLIQMDCKIIISCTHGERIKEQLRHMGILDKLISFEDMIHKLNLKSDALITRKKRNFADNKTIILDMYEGIGWGGTEIWAAEAAKGFAERGCRVMLFGSQEQTLLSEDAEAYAVRFQDTNTIEDMTYKIIENLPCTIINNFTGCVSMAAFIVKERYPDEVKIISVIHNDSKSIYEEQVIFKTWMDHFFCVSNKIRETMIQCYGMNSSKVSFKEQPLAFEEQIKRRYSEKNEPIRIAYAGRLVKQQKRADLMADIIRMLEKKKINYVLEIAGEGDCEKEMKEFVLSCHLQEKVKLLGRLDKTNMPAFWKNQDIYLNFSEYEGTSLSMLEAMSFGCVPVVTDVSGAKEFIEDAGNGFICKIGEMDNICEAIKILDNNRSLLNSFGTSSRKIIKERCNRTKFFDFLEKII